MTPFSSTPRNTQSDANQQSAFNPYIRHEEPLTHVANRASIYGPVDTWLITRYDDAVALFKDARFVKDRRKIDQAPAEQSAYVQPSTEPRHMLNTDPPDHTRLRGLTSKAFTPRMIEQLRPRIQEMTDELIDAVEKKGKMDVYADFALPLPSMVISEMLGVPQADRSQVYEWIQTTFVIKPESDSGQAEGNRLKAAEDFYRYLVDLLASKRAHPGDDLISGLLQARDHGNALSEEELISTIRLLIIAAHDTTVNLISNGTLALLEHPDQLHRLQRDPSLIVSAVEELLRYVSPLKLSTERWANEDVVLHDQLIQKGDLVVISLISTNTEEAHFAHPEELDLARQVNKHLAFGKGIHMCLGAPLARLEGQIAFETLLRRLPNLHLAVDPAQLEWELRPIIIGLAALPVTF